MSGHVGDAHAKYLLANQPNDLTSAGRPKDPIMPNDTNSVLNRYVIPLIPIPSTTPAPNNADAIVNARTINRILKALKGVGIIHFKPITTIT